jgi:hypothetical protein
MAQQMTNPIGGIVNLRTGDTRRRVAVDGQDVVPLQRVIESLARNSSITASLCLGKGYGGLPCSRHLQDPF